MQQLETEFWLGGRTGACVSDVGAAEVKRAAAPAVAAFTAAAAAALSKAIFPSYGHRARQVDHCGLMAIYAHGKRNDSRLMRV